MFLSGRLLVGYLLLFFFQGISAVYGQSEKIKFIRFTSKNGIAGNRVNTIYQDKTGYIWIATNSGLNKFDAYQCKTYRHNPKDINSISHNNVMSLLTDSKDNLWIGTNNGLNLYNKETDTFTRFHFSPQDPSSLSNNYISCIYRDKSGNIWIGAWDGLNKMTIEYGKDDKVKSVKFKRYLYSDSINHAAIRSILEDDRGQLWISNFRNRAYIFDLKQGRYTPFYSKGALKGSKQIINKIYKDSENKLWFANWVDGLSLLNEKKDGLIHYKGSSMRRQNQINDILEDSQHNLWLGTEGGLLLYDRNSQSFQEYTGGNSEGDLSQSIITCIFEDRSQGMWIGSLNGGVNYFNLKNKKFKNYKSEGISSPGVEAILTDPDEAVLVATANALFKFDQSKLKLKEIPFSNLDKKYKDIGELCIDTMDNNYKLFIGSNEGLSVFRFKENALEELPESPLLKDIQNIHIKDLYTDNKGNTWVCSRESLSRINSKSQIKHFYHSKNPHSLWNSVVFKIFSDSKGQIWVLVNGSLEKMVGDPSSDSIRFIHYPYKNFENIENIGQKLPTICENKNGDFWIGTNENLLHFDKNKKTYTTYTTKNGLALDNTMGILADDQGNIWMSTDYSGIIKLNPASGTIWNYTMDDGIGQSTFNFDSYAKSKSGEMYFGGDNGFVFFHPDSIADNSIAPPVVFTDFKLFNKTIHSGPDSPLIFDINETKEIELSYKQSFISIGFSALNYYNPHKNNFAYKLEGLDKEWIYCGQRREATYANLAPGKYTFRVIASNNDGIWNKGGKSLTIIISPPFWATWWFRTLAFLIILCSAVSFYLIRIKRVKRQNVLLQNIVRERTLEIEQQKKEITLKADNLQEANSLLTERQNQIQEQADEIETANEELIKLNATKDKFFSIIAHDLKNPFQGILFLSEQLSINYDGMKDSLKKEFVSDIKNSTQGAYNLLENLLSWAGSQMKKIKFEPEIFNLQKLVENTVNVLTVSAVNKNIELCSVIESEMLVFADKNMVSAVIRNLVHNAIKFTKNSGKVTIDASYKDGFVEISVSDTGIGMAKETIDQLFRIDHHNSKPGTSGESGTGLGLVISKEFIDKHQGNIRVESIPGEGSTFIVSLPDYKEIIENKKSEFRDHDVNESQAIETVILSEKNEGDEEKINKERKRLIIIEDNTQIRVNLKKYLESEYEVSEAENGRIGTSLAIEIIPDLIVSDLMMPEMNGFEVCRSLKSNELTSHIPIILLTASSSDESKIKGLETQADDYITKPFNHDILRLKIKNLIKSREELQKRFSREVKLEASDISITSVDAVFLEKAIAIVEREIDEPELSVSKLSEELNISRVQLYRKINGLTGQSPNEFIRTIRLKRAARLLLQSGLTVKEIAFKVGFSDPSYFAKAFRTQFGITPSDYIIKNSGG